MPRAIAPEVTTTTSTPRRVQRGDLLADPGDDGQAQRAGVLGDDRGAELDDGDGHGRNLRRVQLEDDAADLDVVARFESGALQRADHAHPPQAATRPAPAPPRSRGPSAAIRRSTESPTHDPGAVRPARDVEGRRRRRDGRPRTRRPRPPPRPRARARRPARATSSSPRSSVKPEARRPKRSRAPGRRPASATRRPRPTRPPA